MKRFTKEGVIIITIACIIGTSLLGYAVINKMFTSHPLDLPIMSIQLNNNFPYENIDRIDYVDADISISNAKNHNLETVKAEIRGRGNTSWSESGSYKPYHIKFDKKQSLFGEYENKHWVITSWEKEFHALGLTMAKVFTNFEYVSSWHLFNLRINNVNRGMYMLMEDVRVDEGRVDAEYLLEYDGTARENHAGEAKIEDKDWFNIDGLSQPFRIHSPDPDYITSDQVNSIKTYIQQVLDTANNGFYENLINLIGINSFVDMYIFDQLIGNKDYGWSSQFLYKKQNGKLYMGPPWDFNNLMFKKGEKYDEILKSKVKDGRIFELYDALERIPEFMNLVRLRFNELSPTLRITINNFMFPKKNLEYKKWLLNRIDWLNKYWAIRQKNTRGFA